MEMRRPDRERKEYLCTDIEEILELPAIDFGKGRIQEVLKACRILHEKGEHIVFEVSGPLTILNVLIDPKYVSKEMRKKPEFMERIFAKLGKEILAYMKLAKEQGADLSVMRILPVVSTFWDRKWPNRW